MVNMIVISDILSLLVFTTILDRNLLDLLYAVYPAGVSASPNHSIVFILEHSNESAKQEKREKTPTQITGPGPAGRFGQEPTKPSLKILVVMHRVGKFKANQKK